MSMGNFICHFPLFMATTSPKKEVFSPWVLFLGQSLGWRMRSCQEWHRSWLCFSLWGDLDYWCSWTHSAFPVLQRQVLLLTPIQSSWPVTNSKMKHLFAKHAQL